MPGGAPGRGAVPRSPGGRRGGGGPPGERCARRGRRRAGNGPGPRRWYERYPERGLTDRGREHLRRIRSLGGLVGSEAGRRLSGKRCFTVGFHVERNIGAAPAGGRGSRDLWRPACFTVRFHVEPAARLTGVTQPPQLLLSRSRGRWRPLGCAPPWATPGANRADGFKLRRRPARTGGCLPDRPAGARAGPVPETDVRGGAMQGEVRQSVGGEPSRSAGNPRGRTRRFVGEGGPSSDGIGRLDPAGRVGNRATSRGRDVPTRAVAGWERMLDRRLRSGEDWRRDHRPYAPSLNAVPEAGRSRVWSRGESRPGTAGPGCPRPCAGRTPGGRRRGG